MKSRILAFILVLSLVANAYFILLDESPVGGAQAQMMQARINSLERENERLEIQTAQNNQSLQSYASQLDFYRDRVFELENSLQACPAGMEGFATMQAPAVFQRIGMERSGPFIREVVSEEGALINISVETRAGQGRVLVQTMPLMGVIFQDAANTAVFVAQQETGVSLSGTDVIFSIDADHEIPGVDGSSAGALMTLLTISAIEGRELNDSVTLTGTIDNQGNIGSIGGVFEKATAAEAGGKTLFLLPRENRDLVTYNLVERRVGGFTVVERVPEVVDAEEYLEERVDIDVQYVDTIDDVIRHGIQNRSHSG